MNFKNISVAKIILALTGLFLVFWIARAGYFGYRGYVWRRQVQALEDALTKPLREDTYGGKTPEETWAMFLSAVKSQNMTLASQYFYVDKQLEYKKDLERMLADGSLAKWLPELKKIRLSQNQPLSTNERYYSVDYYNSEYKTILTERIVFLKNPYTKIWKIVVL